MSYLILIYFEIIPLSKENKEKKTRKKILEKETIMELDKETIITILIIAIMGAIGIVTLVGAMFGLSFAKLGIITVLGLIVGVAGLIFGALVIANTKC